MNSRKFDRKTVERYISNGFDIPKFMAKYEFSDEEEFRTQLIRIYSDEQKVDRMISDLKRKNKKEERKKTPKMPSANTGTNTNKTLPAPALSVISTSNSMAVQQNVQFLPVNKLDTPFTVTSTNLVDLAKFVKNNTEASSESANADETVEEDGIDLSELDKLKIELSENEDYLVDLSNDISEKKITMSSKISQMQVSVDTIKELERKIEKERIHFISLIQGIDQIEAECQEQIELRKMLTKDIAELKEKIEQMETKKVFFGTSKDGKYDIYAEDIQIPAIVLMNKLQELANTGKYEDFSLGNLRTLARMLCIITEIRSNEKIKILVSKSDYADLIESFTELSEHEVIVVD